MALKRTWCGGKEQVMAPKMSDGIENFNNLKSLKRLCWGQGRMQPSMSGLTRMLQSCLKNPVCDFLRSRGCVDNEFPYGLDGVAEVLVLLLYLGGWKLVKVLFASLSGMFRDDDHIVPHVRRSLNGLKDNCICSRSGDDSKLRESTQN